jgi:hypothetical protein
MIDTVAEGLWRRVRDAALAERRLEAFAFAPEAPAGPAAARVDALAADPDALDALAHDVTLRAVAAAAESANYRLLARLGDATVPLETLARAVALPALAVSERVSALAQAGLAARALDHDAVAATEAGRGLVALIDAIGRAVAARCRGGLGAP